MSEETIDFIQAPHVMVDLETYGTGPHAAITAIGAVVFDPYSDPQVIDEEDILNVRVDLSKSRSPGNIDPATVEWWMQQSDEARAALLAEGRVSLETALQAFADFCFRKVPGGTFGPGLLKEGVMWSNGPMFDERLLREAFQRHGVLFPFNFRGSNDCRTMLRLGQQLGWKPTKHEKREARADLVKHDAADDAVYQARGINSIVAHLKGIQVEA